MSTHSRIQDKPVEPQARTAFRVIKVFVSVYLGLSWAAVLATAFLRDNADLVTSAVWVRGIIVVVVSILTLSFAIRASRRQGPALVLLRIASIAMLVAVVVIVAIPGSFPLWFKAEQGLCGLLLLGVILVAFGKPVRAMFAAK